MYVYNCIYTNHFLDFLACFSCAPLWCSSPVSFFPPTSNRYARAVVFGSLGSTHGKSSSARHRFKELPGGPTGPAQAEAAKCAQGSWKHLRNPWEIYGNLGMEDSDSQIITLENYGHFTCLPWTLTEMGFNGPWFLLSFSLSLSLPPSPSQ